MEISVTDSGRVTVYLSSASLQRSVKSSRYLSCFQMQIRRKIKEKAKDGLCFCPVQCTFWYSGCHEHLTAEGGDYLWQLILSESGHGLHHCYWPFSLLNPILAGFSEGFTSGIEGGSLLTCCQLGHLQMMVWRQKITWLHQVPACASMLKSRPCQDVVPVHSAECTSPFSSQNFSLL